MDIPRREWLTTLVASAFPLSKGTEDDEVPGFGEGFGTHFGGPVEDPECFIATASAGYKSEDVQELRRFRDETLKRYRLGRAFTTLYYRLSPPVARWIERSERRKSIVRKLIVRPAAALIP